MEDITLIFYFLKAIERQGNTFCVALINSIARLNLIRQVKVKYLFLKKKGKILMMEEYPNFIIQNLLTNKNKLKKKNEKIITYHSTFYKNLSLELVPVLWRNFGQLGT